jgi:hypothetical protein
MIVGTKSVQRNHVFIHTYLSTIVHICIRTAASNDPPLNKYLQKRTDVYSGGTELTQITTAPGWIRGGQENQRHKFHNQRIQRHRFYN